MNKFIKIFNKVVLINLLILELTMLLPNRVIATSSNFSQEIYPITQCNDGIDNDGDGLIDFAFDPQCTSWVDNNESPDPEPPVSFPEEPEEVEPPVVIPIFNIPIPEEVEENLEPINDILTQFLWSPIGKALGVDERILRRESTGYTSITLVLLSTGYLVIVVGVIYLYVKARKNNRKAS